jgi:two-component system sensor histidine kinase VicK
MDKYHSIASLGDKSNDGVFIYTLPENDFVYNNHHFKEIFRIGNGEKPAVRGLLRYVLSEDKTYLESRYQELLEKGSISSTEFRIRFDPETVKHLCCDIYRLDNGTTLVGFIKDITQSKEHENYLVEYTAKKDTFLDMITHNLAGPLNLSQNILGWVEKSLLNKEDATALIGLLHESIQECIEIVNDFLKEEHRESQTIFVKKTRFNIIGRLNVVVGKLKELNPDKQFTLVAELEHENINTDSVKFFQVMHNLLSNAVKFTQPNGEIKIKVEEDTEAFTITIQDNGIGIPANLQPYIFNNRSRASREGLKGEKSNGVGLYLIKKLVDLIGGSIWFESEENKGTSFFVKLPKE